MKYSQYSRKNKGNSAFYIITALCLVLIGVAAWFAFTRMDNTKTMPEDTSSINSKVESNIKEYESNFESYTENETPSSQNPSSTPNQNNTSSDHTASAEAEKVKAYKMPVNGEVLKDFNTDALQYSATYNDMRIHAAVDISCDEGSVISALTDGTVTSIENSGELGKCVTIDHGDSLIIKYCGLENVSLEEGSTVKIGDDIGTLGTIPAECADQSHLHIEAQQNGKPVSVLKFFE